MLKITTSNVEQYDEVNELFITSKGQYCNSALSGLPFQKWESKWCKPFLSKDDKTIEESIDYIRCMTITQNVDPNVYLGITDKHIDEVTKYIEASMTATTFRKEKKTINREVITSELIYYWMITMNIPFECQKWHLNRLLTLINICKIKK